MEEQASAVNSVNRKGSWKINWDSEPKKYKHFTDMGKYLLIQNDIDYSECDRILEYVRNNADPFKAGCTATVKLNKKGEVIVGRNMDVEISQNPAIITRINGGKYDTVSFYYGGISSEYKYSQLEEYDNDVDVLGKHALFGTDAMNEAGLYVEANMREMDDEVDFYCHGTNPGKERACVLCAPTLICANCATVYEAVDYLNNSYDWYTLGFGPEDKKLLWNLALIVGDAEGNYGLIEFGMDKIYFTPYANGQGNYYIHPDLAEYADSGSGYGRFAAALKGLPRCETEEDMLHNMEECMWRREILEPGCLGYSDAELSLKARRAATKEELQKRIDDMLTPYQAAAKEFYAGNEKPLRDSGSVWTTGFNFGVNCAKKHLILRLWEDSDAIFEYQW